jgi:YidC/Oxa1 family membrane protein insertase
MTPIAANPLQPLIDVAHEILRFWHDTVGLSWGMSIIGLTVVVRLFILPLTFKQVKSMQALQQLQPEIKKIQERYKGDRQRMNQEMMRFYQENKVNPLSSCLPIVLQLPFFISLFYLLRSDEFKQDIKGEEEFLFIPNLAEKVTGEPVVLAVLIVLYLVTQLGSSLVTAISADRTQRMILLALPFVFAIFIVNFEAGLIVYWITTNIWTIGQQLLVRKLYPKPAPLAAGAGAAAAVRGGGAGARGAAKGDGDGDGEKPAARGGKAAASEGANGGPRKAPPPNPRKKKKRSGRRR